MAAIEPPAMPARRRQLAGGALVSLGSQVAAMGGAGIAGVVLARVVGSDGVGVYSLVQNVILIGAVVCALGLPGGVTYVASRGRWTDRAALRETAAASALLGVLGGLVAVGVWALLRDSALDGVTPPMAVLSGVGLAGMLAFNVWVMLLLARERYEAYGVAQLVQAGALAIGTIVGAIAGDTTGAVVGFVGGQACSTAWCLWSVRARGPRATTAVPAGAKPPPTATAGPASTAAGDPAATATAAATAAGSGPLAPWRGLRQARSFGVRLWSADVLQIVNYRVDFFLLNAFATRAAVGHYAIAVSLTALAWVLPGALATVLFPSVASLDAQDARAAHERSEQAVRHTVALLAPTALVLVAILLVGVPILYGSGFHATIGLGLILLPGALALGVAKVLSAIIGGRGRPTYALYNTLLTMPPTVVLYVVLIPGMGAAGAALASSLSYVATVVIGAFFYRRATGASIWPALRPSRALLDDYRLALRNVRVYVRHAGARRARPS